MNLPFYPLFSLLFFALFLSGCSKHSINPKSKRYHLSEKQNSCISFPPYHTPLKSPNPFLNHAMQKKMPLITKNAFICKGSTNNPVISNPPTYPQEYLQDCPGGEYHGFPEHNGKEYINPELILLLNHIQSTLQSPITITTGHQCKKHFDYCQSPSSNLPHLFGSAVIFTVDQARITPEEICMAIKSFYNSSTDSEIHKFIPNLPYPNMNNARISVLFFYDTRIKNIEMNEQSFIQIIMKNIPINIDLK